MGTQIFFNIWTFIFGQDSFYRPPLFFLSAICFSDVFSDYKTFSSVAFLSEMDSLGDIGWVRLG